MVSALAGRWLACRDDGEDMLLIINESGGVTFVGDGAELRLEEDVAEGGFHLKESDGSQLACAVLNVEGDVTSLAVTDKDGTSEKWIRAEETPKFVARKIGSLARRWTREDQQGSPKASHGKKELFHRGDENVEDASGAQDSAE
eukprot:TRINITY_DN71555_c0_g1_i1.p1 TRINITY_DN71555_c0_g1~~TRINITY_DN71555_c0_g1_i1.p1  ORF type:complete len:159 (+),score=41.69 TRINITY_DN71555_c0_g1_i1:46-477(+)